MHGQAACHQTISGLTNGKTRLGPTSASRVGVADTHYGPTSIETSIISAHGLTFIILQICVGETHVLHGVPNIRNYRIE